MRRKICGVCATRPTHTTLRLWSESDYIIFFSVGRGSVWTDLASVEPLSHVTYPTTHCLLPDDCYRLMMHMMTIKDVLSTDSEEKIY